MYDITLTLEDRCFATRDQLKKKKLFYSRNKNVQNPKNEDCMLIPSSSQTQCLEPIQGNN